MALYGKYLARSGLLFGESVFLRPIGDLYSPWLLSTRRFSKARSFETSSLKNRRVTITVEGNIGSGKSTLLDYFGKVGGVEEKSVRFLERSIYSARYCFVENLHQRASLSSLEHAILDEWFHWLLAAREINVDFIIYLQTRPEVAHRRVKARCREEETCVSLDYLQDLHDLHEDWLVQGKFPRPAPVFVVDANDDIDGMVKKYEDCYELFQKHLSASSLAARPSVES